MRREGGTTLTSLTRASAMALRRFSLLLPFGYACSGNERMLAIPMKRSLTQLSERFAFLPHEGQSKSRLAGSPGGRTFLAGSVST